MSARGVLGAVAAIVFVLQIASATFLVRDFETPNTSTRIARTLAATGEFALPVGANRSWRAFQLPGEPLYLVAGFRFLPASLHRYLHVPVAALLAVAVAGVAFVLGGRSVALVAGLLASADPFVLAHGPVWDDTFLAAALEWTVLALVLTQLTHAPAKGRPRWPVMLAVAGCAGWAAVTRSQSQLVLGAVALGVFTLPALRPIRPLGRAIVAGMALAVGLWGARNVIVLGSFLIGSTHDGQTLLQSNYPRARAALIETGVTETYADLRTRTDLGELQLDAHLRDAALGYLKSDPAGAALTAGLKIGVSLLGLDLGASLASWRNIGAAGLNIVLVLFGARGLWVWWRQAPASPLATSLALAGTAIAVVTLLMLAIGPVGLRYRIDFAGVLYIGTALTVAGAAPASRARVSVPA